MVTSMGPRTRLPNVQTPHLQILTVPQTNVLTPMKLLNVSMLELSEKAEMLILVPHMKLS